jgi:hypothetical protein
MSPNTLTTTSPLSGQHLGPHAPRRRDTSTTLRALTEDWGTTKAVAMYLDRCQIDTPADVVSAVWEQVLKRRRSVGTVVDFGAGDGRFSYSGTYSEYIGYEIDASRCQGATLPAHATLLNRCAFADTVSDADLCLGNPPYVRNQDLPLGWRRRAASVVKARTGVKVSGLANAWQYFALLALASTKKDGLVALVIPYEWVSRPSARALRVYIESNGWEVAAYRLRDETFRQVLTTSSITIIDKRKRSAKWLFFSEADRHTYEALASAAGGKAGVVPYASRTQTADSRVQVKRGLSPGTQEVLTLTEGERVRAGLKVDLDVVPCITSLRAIGAECRVLSESVFRKCLRNTGAKCWLIRTDRKPSVRLLAYLHSVPRERYQTSTCTSRETWWQFHMPTAARALIASGFRGQRPKAVVNGVGAIAVGSVSAVFGLSRQGAVRLVESLRSIRVASRIVAHSNGMLKLEIGQLNTVIQRLRLSGQDE